METKTAQLQLRKATKKDVLNPDGTDLRMGVLYFIESTLQQGTFCGPLYSGDHTDKKEFSTWYKEQRIWVPLMALDNKVILVTEKTEE